MKNPISKLILVASVLAIAAMFTVPAPSAGSTQKSDSTERVIAKKKEKGKKAPDAPPDDVPPDTPGKKGPGKKGKKKK